MYIDVVIGGTSEAYKTNYKKIDNIVYRNNNLEKVYNEVKKLIIPEISKYLNIKRKYEIEEVDRTDSNLDDWIVGKAKSAKLIYLSQDMYEDDIIYNKIKEFINYFNDKLFKNSKLNKFMIIDPQDDSYSLDITFRK